MPILGSSIDHPARPAPAYGQATQIEWFRMVTIVAFAWSDNPQIDRFVRWRPPIPLRIAWAGVSEAKPTDAAASNPVFFSTKPDGGIRNPSDGQRHLKMNALVDAGRRGARNHTRVVRRAFLSGLTDAAAFDAHKSLPNLSPTIHPICSAHTYFAREPSVARLRLRLPTRLRGEG